MEQTNNAEVTSSSTGVDTSYQAPAEKMLPQSKVDEIVKSVKHDTAQKIRAQYEGQAQQVNSNANVDVNEIKRVAAEAAQEESKKQYDAILQQQRQEYATQQGARIAADFDANLEAVKDKYPDFDATVKSFPFGAFPNSVFVSTGFDNGGDIIVELAKNPTKFDQLESLAHRDPSLNLMQKEMKRLSDSIRINEKAATVKTANPPLSQIQPSSIGSDNGTPSLVDLKKLYRG
jgi:ABC-type Fe3+-hydroxamate transport system substrate-binding protein